MDENPSWERHLQPPKPVMWHCVTVQSKHFSSWFIPEHCSLVHYSGHSSRFSHGDLWFQQPGGREKKQCFVVRSCFFVARELLPSTSKHIKFKHQITLSGGQKRTFTWSKITQPTRGWWRRGRIHQMNIFPINFIMKNHKYIIAP